MVVRIVLADDFKAVRHWTKGLLEAEPGFQVVGEACNGYEAIKLVDDLHPDVLLVDISMPYPNGIEVTREVHVRHPCTSIVVLSTHNLHSYVEEALEAGAIGYLVKEVILDRLGIAIRECMSGRRYIDIGTAGKRYS